MIELKHLTKVFAAGGREIKALDQVSLHVPEGKIYGVIGSSGAGKSTLIRCVNLLEKPDSGEIIINGQDLMQLSDAELRAARSDIGMIFQHFNLLANRTVYDNVALPLELAGIDKTAIRAAVQPLLVLTGLDSKVEHYPSQLSGGQKQRVAIARALASKPKVLLCDEATSALDPQTTRSILELLKDINQQLNITILMITHEMDVVKTICDQVAVMSFGQIIEENEVEQFFIQPKTELAKSFIRDALHEKPANELGAALAVEPFEGSHPVVRVTFVGQDVAQPLVSGAARKFDIDFNILQADIEQVHEKTMGFLTVSLIGTADNITLALEFLQQRVQVEVLGYVS